MSLLRLSLTRQVTYLVCELFRTMFLKTNKRRKIRRTLWSSTLPILSPICDQSEDEALTSRLDADFLPSTRLSFWHAWQTLSRLVTDCEKNVPCIIDESRRKRLLKLAIGGAHCAVRCRSLTEVDSEHRSLELETRNHFRADERVFRLTRWALRSGTRQSSQIRHRLGDFSSFRFFIDHS